MELTAIEHVEFEDVGRVVQIKAIATKIAFGLLHKIFDGLVEGVVLVRKLLRYGLQQSELFRSLIHMHDVHSGRAESTKYRRESKGHRFFDVGHEAFGVRRPCATTDEKDEVLRAV